MSSFANAVRLSRLTSTNIVFVALASLGGLFSAFYFFNGAEVLRAAAAWPNEFLYLRPVFTEKIDTKVQPNPTDQFARSASNDKTSSSGGNMSDSQFTAQPNLGPSNVTPTSNSTVPTNEPVTPAGPVVPLPIIVPPVFPPRPPPSVLDDLNAILNGTASGANELAQSDLQQVCQASDLAARLQAV